MGGDNKEKRGRLEGKEICSRPWWHASGDGWGEEGGRKGELPDTKHAQGHGKESDVITASGLLTSPGIPEWQVPVWRHSTQGSSHACSGPKQSYSTSIHSQSQRFMMPYNN